MNTPPAETPVLARPGSAALEDPLAEMFCYSVYAAGLAFNRAYKPKLDALGITYLQYLALLLLRRRGVQSIKQLGDRLSLDSNTLTPLIKRLEAGGFVTRRRDPEDERVVRVALTPEGEKTVDAAIGVSRDLAKNLKLAPEQVLALKDLLDKIGQRMSPGD